MPLVNATPFRQIVRTYSAMLNARHKIAHPLEAPVNLYERLGFTFLLERSSLVDRVMIETGTWEPQQLAYFAGLVERFRDKPAAAFFDIGSYWGLYSLLAWRSGVFDKMVAFDGDRHNFAKLQANLFLNNAAYSITAMNKAVSDKPGELRFWDSRTHPDKNRAGVGVVEDGRPSYPVEAVTVDSFVSSTGGYLLLKIDVEGHEESVLKGMHNTLANNKVVMQIEIYEPQHERVFAEVGRLGLRQIHSIYPDYYLTNMTVEELGV